MNMDDCIHPDCLIQTDFGKACEHSCPYERGGEKKEKPSGQGCVASEVPGASCQFPRCDC